jgi:hypothetical protein
MLQMAFQPALRDPVPVAQGSLQQTSMHLTRRAQAEAVVHEALLQRSEPCCWMQLRKQLQDRSPIFRKSFPSRATTR